MPRGPKLNNEQRKMIARSMLSMEPELHEKAHNEAKRLRLTYNAFMVLLLRAYFGEVEFGRISNPDKD